MKLHCRVLGKRKGTKMTDMSDWVKDNDIQRVSLLYIRIITFPKTSLDCLPRDPNAGGAIFNCQRWSLNQLAWSEHITNYQYAIKFSEEKMGNSVLYYNDSLRFLDYNVVYFTQNILCTHHNSLLLLSVQENFLITENPRNYNLKNPLKFSTYLTCVVSNLNDQV